MFGMTPGAKRVRLVSMRMSRVVKVAILVVVVGLVVGYFAARPSHTSTAVRVETAFRTSGLPLVSMSDGITTSFVRPHAAQDPLRLRVIVSKAKFGSEFGQGRKLAGLRVYTTPHIWIEYDPNAPGASRVVGAVARLRN